ncbi:MULTISPECIES: hypothetical protein [unclassified Microcoleus]
MATKLEVDRQKLYETDYQRWIETTVEKLPVVWQKSSIASW